MSDRLIRRLIPAAIFMAICISYGNTLHDPFIFDDGDAIVHNPQIRSVWPLSESMSAPPLSVLVGRPLVSLSLAVNYSLGGLDPLGYHLFNIATHIACALLIYGILCGNPLVPSVGFAGAVAMIWALHPLQTECVTYITQRTETMMSMFLLLMIFALTRAGWGWRIVAVAACAAGMACKEIMIVAPLLAMLYAWMFLPRKTPRGMHVALMACWIILPLELAHADMESKSGYGLKYVYWFDYLKTQAGVICHYLRLAVWPSGQAIDYFDWPIVKSLGPAVLPSIFLGALFIATLIGCARRRWWGFLGAWFFLILAPTSSILPNFTEIAAERRMYLPLLPVVILVCAALWRVTGRAAILALMIVVLGVLTIARNQVYRSTIALWSDAVAKRPDNPRARTYLGMAYADAGDWDDARAQDDAALRLSPNLAMAADLRGRLQNSSTRPGTPVLPADP